MKPIDIYEPLPGGKIRVRGLTEWRPVTEGEPLDWSICEECLEIVGREFDWVWEDAVGDYVVEASDGDRGIVAKVTCSGMTTRVTINGKAYAPDSGHCPELGRYIYQLDEWEVWYGSAA